MNTLIDDIFRMLAHKLQNVFDECLVWQTTESNAIFARTGRNDMLREQGWELRDRRWW